MWLPASASFALLVLAYSSPSLSAQVPPDPPIFYQCLPFEPDNTVEWPEDGHGSPTFGQLVLGDLNGDLDPDAVVLASGTPVVLWNIALFDAPRVIQFPSKPAPTAVTGLAAVPGAGVNGWDGVVMTDWRGLFLVTWNEGDVFNPPDFNDPLILNDVAWANAGPIHAVDLDNNGSLEFIGIAEDRRSILVYYPATATNLVLPLSSDAFDVVGANWNQAGRREICALTAEGLRIYTTAGALLATVGHVATSGCITRVRTSSSGELVAWTRPASAGGSELVVLAHQHNEAARSLAFDFCGDLSGITPVALVAGNYDADLPVNDELVLVHAGQNAVVLINQGVANQHFVTDDPEHYDIVPLSETPLDAGIVGIPAFTQIDGEDPADVNPDDLVFPVSTTEKVHVFLRLPYYRTRVATGTAPPNSGDIFEELTEYHHPINAPGTLHLAFELLPRYSDYNFVELTVWHQPVEGEDLESLAVSYTRYTLAEGAPAHQYITVPYGFPAGDCWPQPEWEVQESPCFYTELRFIKTASPEIRSKAFTAGFRLRNCEGGTDYELYLVTLGIPGADFQLDDDTDLPPEVMGIGELGIYVPMSSQPPFDDGLVPLPPPPSRPTLTYGQAHVSFD